MTPRSKSPRAQAQASPKPPDTPVNPTAQQAAAYLEAARKYAEESDARRKEEDEEAEKVKTIMKIAKDLIQRTKSGTNRETDACARNDEDGTGPSEGMEANTPPPSAVDPASGEDGGQVTTQGGASKTTGSTRVIVKKEA